VLPGFVTVPACDADIMRVSCYDVHCIGESAAKCALVCSGARWTGVVAGVGLLPAGQARGLASLPVMQISCVYWHM
jgi:hypothetical protein